MAQFNANEQEIVKVLIETKAVDFQAIGNALAKHGASATLTFSGEDIFCGTMRRFVRVFRIRDQVAGLEQLAELQRLSGEIKG
jgi:hypothetical protein